MSDTINEQRLNDYVDGELTAAEAEEVERLLASSAEARATVEFLRSLRERSARLPASIEPQRDLWPEIERRMAPAPLAAVDQDEVLERTASDPTGRRSWWPRLDTAQWALLAAAAVVLVVSSSAITAWLIGAPQPDAGITARGADTPGVALEQPVPIEARYAAEIEDLMWALYENRETLDPDTVTTIETNMRVIDRAIRRVREALDEDPSNAGLNRMLDNNYRHKLQLLRRANRIIEMS